MRTLEELCTALAQDIYTGCAPECKVRKDVRNPGAYIIRVDTDGVDYYGGEPGSYTPHAAGIPGCLDRLPCNSASSILWGLTNAGWCVEPLEGWQGLGREQWAGEAYLGTKETEEEPRFRVWMSGEYGDGATHPCMEEV